MSLWLKVLLPLHGDDDGAFAGADVALQQEHLLPGAQEEPALVDRHGQRRAEQGGLQMRMAVAVVPGPFVAVLLARRDQRSSRAGRSSFRPGSNSMVPTAAVLPTQNTCATPVWIAGLTTLDTRSGRACRRGRAFSG